MSPSQQGDEIAPGPASDEKNAILGFQKPCVALLFPGHEPGQDVLLAAAKVFPGLGGRRSQVGDTERAGGEMRKPSAG
jgi:hypothetical protein